MKLLEGKTALITGAARGIGKAIALKFASEGANIAFTDLVIDEIGKETEAEIAALGVKVKGYASNAADFAQTETVVAQVKEEFGSVDILVNNAGITKDAGTSESREYAGGSRDKEPAPSGDGPGSGKERGHEDRNARIKRG